jgi:capsular exopolysaccharide synthesis family protein
MLSALNEARTARIQAEARWRLRQAQSGPSSPEVLQSPAIQELKKSRAMMEAKYQQAIVELRPDSAEAKAMREQIDAIDQQIAAEARNIQATLSAGRESEYRVALAQEKQLEGQVNQLKGQVLDLRGRSIDYDILQREVDTSRQLYDGLLQAFRESGVASNLGATNIWIIDPAQPPHFASKPRPVRTVLTAIILGLALGIGLAFLFESFDESIRSPEDVEKKLGFPLLGTIPKLDKGTTPVVALQDPRSNFSEAYYSVRTALQFSTNEGVPSSLVVTSARPSEGKSTTSTAIAQHLARLGLRVLLVDSDLRNPSLHKVMSAENTHGFSNYLTGGMSLIQLAQETSTPGLSFIPCGPMPPNPAELLGAAKLQAMLREARAHYDVVLVDAPPVMGLADAPLLASAAAGTILVVEAGGTGRRLAKAAIRRLQVGNAHLLGILLTKFDARKSSYGYGYGYAYDYEYGSRPALKADS